MSKRKSKKATRRGRFTQGPDPFVLKVVARYCPLVSPATASLAIENLTPRFTQHAGNIGKSGRKGAMGSL